MALESMPTCGTTSHPFTRDDATRAATTSSRPRIADISTGSLSLRPCYVPRPTGRIIQNVTATTVGNVRLKAARESLGLTSQTEFVEAINRVAQETGLDLSVTTRTIRRWESTNPPWPHRPHIEALEALFDRRITELGFTPRRHQNSPTSEQSPRNTDPTYPPEPNAATTVHEAVPASTVDDYQQLTASYRHLYWAVPARQLHASVVSHAALGPALLQAVPQEQRQRLAAAAAESRLLAGRIELFDLHNPAGARPQFVSALECAHEAADHELGAAVLAHMALAAALPPAPERATTARENIRMARAFARRAGTPPKLTAWLDAVESEIETRSGNTHRALQLIAHCEHLYAHEAPAPEWLDWFSPARLAGLKASTLLAAGHDNDARFTLEAILHDLPANAAKQRSITYADLAAIAAVQKDPGRACELLGRALDELTNSWHSAAINRINAVRNTLQDWESTPAVHALDERLYDWSPTISALA